MIPRVITRAIKIVKERFETYMKKTQTQGKDETTPTKNMDLI